MYREKKQIHGNSKWSVWKSLIDSFRIIPYSCRRPYIFDYLCIPQRCKQTNRKKQSPRTAYVFAHSWLMRVPINKYSKIRRLDLLDLVVITNFTCIFPSCRFAQVISVRAPWASVFIITIICSLLIQDICLTRTCAFSRCQ